MSKTDRFQQISRPGVKLEYGSSSAAPPPPGRGASKKAKDILRILDSKRNYQQTQQTFNDLLDDSTIALDEAVAAVPRATNPYMIMVRLPDAMRKLRWLSTRKLWYQRASTFRLWIDMVKCIRARDELRENSAKVLQGWVQRRQARIRLAMFTERDPQGDASDGKQYTLKIIKTIRNERACQIQTSVRLHILNPLLVAKQVVFMYHSRREKAAVRLQRVFRGFFARAMFCVTEKVSLHNQLKEWANGNTTKLLYRADLQDLAAQSLLNKGIFMSALGSRPLRSLPPLATIIVTRSQLKALQERVSAEHSAEQTRYVSMHWERQMMSMMERESYFYHIQVKLLRAADEAEKRELEEKLQLFRFEELKRQQRKNAMSVMAHYSLEENNQRVERECMFREDNRMRKLVGTLRKSANARLERDQELMVKEDFLGQDRRLKDSMREAEEQALRTHLAKIRDLRRKDSIPGDESLLALQSVTDNTLFSSFLPWWMRVEAPLVGDAARRTEVPKIIAASFPSAIGTQIAKSVAEVHALHSVDGAKRTRNGTQKKRRLGYGKSKRPNYAGSVAGVGAIQSFPLALKVTGLREDDTEYAKRKRRLNKEELVGNCTVKMVVSAEQQKQYALLKRLRIRRAESQRGYRDLATYTAIFCRQHRSLVEARAALVATKFSTRMERREAAERLSEQELLLPHSRAHVIRQARHLRTLVHREVSLFLEIFGVDVPGTKPSRSADVLTTPEETTMPVQNAAPYPDTHDTYRRGVSDLKQATSNDRENDRPHAFWGEHIPSMLAAFSAKHDVEVPNPMPPPMETIAHDAESMYFEPSDPVDVEDGALMGKESDAGATSVARGPSPANTTTASNATKVGGPSSNLTSRVSSRKRREIQRRKEESGVTLRPEERKHRKIIGHEVFLFPAPALYDFVQWADRVRSWVARVREWLSSIEEVWRKHNRDSVVGCVQRLQWLDEATLYSEERESAGHADPALHQSVKATKAYSVPSVAPLEDHLPPFKHTSADLPPSRSPSSHRDNIHYIAHHDATAAAAARRESVLDLYELLLARCDLVVTVSRSSAVRQRSLHYGDDDADMQDNGTGDGMVITLSSLEAERLLGRHPCNATALFLLQNGLSGGTMSEVRLQYNHQRYYKDMSGGESRATQAHAGRSRTRQVSVQGNGSRSTTVPSPVVAKTDAKKEEDARFAPNKVQKAVNLLRNRFGTYGSQRAPDKSKRAEADKGESKSEKNTPGSRVRSSILSLARRAKRDEVAHQDELLNQAPSKGEGSRVSRVGGLLGNKGNGVGKDALALSLFETGDSTGRYLEIFPFTVNRRGEYYVSTAHIRHGLEKVTAMNAELEREKRDRALMNLAIEDDERETSERVNPQPSMSQNVLLDVACDGQVWRDALVSRIESAMSSYEVGEFGCALQGWVDTCMMMLSHEMEVNHYQKDHRSHTNIPGSHPKDELDVGNLDCEAILEHIDAWELPEIGAKSNVAPYKPNEGESGTSSVEANDALGEGCSKSEHVVGVDLPMARVALFTLFLKRVGDCFYALGRYEAAKDKYFTVRALRAHLYGDGHLLVAECDTCIGRCYVEEGALVEAAAAFEEAFNTLSASEDRLAVDTIRRARGTENAALPRRLKRLTHLVPAGTEDEELLVELFISLHGARARLARYCCDFVSCGDHARKSLAACAALSRLRRVTSVSGTRSSDQAKQSNSPLIDSYPHCLALEARDQLARLSLLCGDNHDAMQQYRTSAVIALQHMGAEHPSFAMALIRLARASIMEVSMDKCLSLVRIALSVLSGDRPHPFLESDPVVIAKALEVRASIYQQYQVDLGQAGESLQAAAEIYAATLGATHPRVTISSALFTAQWLHASGAALDVVLHAYDRVDLASKEIIHSLPLPSSTLARHSEHDMSYPTRREHDEVLRAMEGRASLLVSCERPEEALDIYEDVEDLRGAMVIALDKHRNVEVDSELISEDEGEVEANLEDNDGSKDRSKDRRTPDNVLASELKLSRTEYDSDSAPLANSARAPSASVEFTRLQRAKCLLALGVHEEASRLTILAHKRLLAIVNSQGGDDNESWEGIEDSEAVTVLRSLLVSSPTSDEEEEEEGGEDNNSAATQSSHHFALSESLLLVGTLATLHGEHNAAGAFLDRALEMREFIVGTYHSSLVPVLLALARNYEIPGHYDHALEELMDAIDVYSQQCDNVRRVFDAAGTTVLPTGLLDIAGTTGQGVLWTQLKVDLSEHLRQTANLLRDKYCRHREAGQLYTKAMALVLEDGSNTNDNAGRDESSTEAKSGGTVLSGSWTFQAARIAHDAAINMTFGQFADDAGARREEGRFRQEGDAIVTDYLGSVDHWNGRNSWGTLHTESIREDVVNAAKYLHQQYVNHCSETFGVHHVRTAEALLALVQHMVLSVAGKVGVIHLKKKKTEKERGDMTNEAQRTTGEAEDEGYNVGIARESEDEDIPTEEGAEGTYMARLQETQRKETERQQHLQSALIIIGDHILPILEKDGTAGPRHASTVFAKALSELTVKLSMHSADRMISLQHIEGVVADEEMQQIRKIEGEAIRNINQAITVLTDREKGGCAYDHTHPRVQLLRHWGLEDEEAAPYLASEFHHALAATSSEPGPAELEPVAERGKACRDDASLSPLSSSRSPRRDAARSARRSTMATAETEPGLNVIGMASDLISTLKKTTAAATALAQTTQRDETLHLAQKYSLDEGRVILFVRTATRADCGHLGLAWSGASKLTSVWDGATQRRGALSMYIASQQEQRAKRQEARVEWERRQLHLLERRHEMELSEAKRLKEKEEAAFKAAAALADRAAEDKGGSLLSRKTRGGALWKKALKEGKAAGVAGTSSKAKAKADKAGQTTTAASAIVRPPPIQTVRVSAIANGSVASPKGIKSSSSSPTQKMLKKVSIKSILGGTGDEEDSGDDELRDVFPPTPTAKSSVEPRHSSPSPERRPASNRLAATVANAPSPGLSSGSGSDSPSSSSATSRGRGGMWGKVKKRFTKNSDADDSVGNGDIADVRQSEDSRGGKRSPSSRITPSPSPSASLSRSSPGSDRNTSSPNSEPQGERQGRHRAKNNRKLSLHESTTGFSPGTRRFRRREFEAEIFDFRRLERMKSFRTAEMLLVTKPRYDEDLHSTSVGVSTSFVSRSRTRMNSRLSMPGSSSTDSSLQAQQASVASIEAPSPTFLAHYHHYPLMTRMIQEEVTEAESVVKRLADWGLLCLHVTDSTGEKTSNGASNSTSSSRNEARQGDLELTLLRGKLKPTLFIKTHITLDHWTVSIPRWMRPVAYSGTAAGGEPFWRRLAHERRHGILGEYTRIDDKDKRVDKVGKTLLYVLHSRTRASQLRREAIVAPVRERAETALMGYEDSLSKVVRRVNPPLVRVEGNPLVLRAKPVTLKHKRVSYTTQCLRALGWAKISPSDHDDDIVLSGPPYHLYHDVALAHLEADRRLLRGRVATKQEKRTGISAACRGLSKDFLSISLVSRKKPQITESYGDADDIHATDAETPEGAENGASSVQDDRDDSTYGGDADDDDETESIASTTSFGSAFTSSTVNTLATSKRRAKEYPIQSIATAFSEIKPVMQRRVKKLSRRSSWVTGEEVHVDGETGMHKSLTSPESRKHKEKEKEKQKDSRAKLGWSKLRKLGGVIGAGSTPIRGSLEIDITGRGSSSAPASPSNSTAPSTPSDRSSPAGSPSPTHAHHYTGYDHTPQSPGERLARLVEEDETALEAFSWLHIPEVWVCGACNDGVVVFMRVIDNEEEVPRGGPVAELAHGDGAQAMRSLYAAHRALCDDDHHHHHDHYEQLVIEQEEGKERRRRNKKAQHFNKHAQIRPFHRASDVDNEHDVRYAVQRHSSGVHHHLHRHRFADYMAINGRMLSVYAMQRMRCHPHLVSEMELPQPEHYFAHMAREVYTNRHAWMESKNQIAKIQGLIRMRIARRRIALIKEKLEEGLKEK